MSGALRKIRRRMVGNVVKGKTICCGQKMSRVYDQQYDEETGGMTSVAMLVCDKCGKSIVIKED